MTCAQALNGKCSLLPLSLLSNGCFPLPLAGKDDIRVLICSISLDVKNKKRKEKCMQVENPYPENPKCSEIHLFFLSS